MRYILKYLYIFFFLPLLVFSQQSKIDSLQKNLQTQKDDTNKVNLLNELGKQYWLIGDFINAKIYAEKGLGMNRKILLNILL